VSAPVIAETRLSAARVLSAGTVLIRLERPENFPDPFPGQFAKLKILSAAPNLPPGLCGAGFLDRPFSFHAQTADELSFLIREAGAVSGLFKSLSPGAKIRITGPLGRAEDSLIKGRDPLILVAGGAGLAPMGMIRRENFPRVLLLYGEKTGEAQADEGYLDSLAPDRISLTEDGSGRGGKGLPTEALSRALEALTTPALVFACGPPGLLRECARLCAERPRAKCLISAETFLACGLGVCLSCSFSARDGSRRRLCVDGPVFPAELLNF
jgi:dihydroorotate dehydrogenase electron transfer subunit